MADGEKRSAGINEYSPIERRPCRLGLDQSKTPGRGSRGSHGRLVGIPVGYRLVSLIMSKLSSSPQVPSTPSSFFECLTGHKFCVRALCLDETQYDQEHHRAPQVAAQLAQARESGERDPQGYLQRNHPAWRLFPVEIETLVDQRTGALLSNCAA